MIRSLGHRIFQPWSVTLPQLYGGFDDATHEWADGLLPATFRAAQKTAVDWALVSN